MSSKRWICSVEYRMYLNQLGARKLQMRTSRVLSTTEVIEIPDISKQLQIKSLLLLDMAVILFSMSYWLYDKLTRNKATFESRCCIQCSLSLSLYL